MAAHQLPKLSELSQREVVTNEMGHPVFALPAADTLRERVRWQLPGKSIDSLYHMPDSDIDVVLVSLFPWYWKPTQRAGNDAFGK